MIKNKGFASVVAILAVAALLAFLGGGVAKSAGVRFGSGGAVKTTSAGITSLGGLTGASQTFGNDTNVTMVSSGSTHTLTWAGTLADARVVDSLTISGGTVNNTPIGASTPSTAIFSNSTSTLLSVSTQLKAGVGSVAVPSYSFDADEDTGLYQRTAGTINFITNATSIAELTGTALFSQVSASGVRVAWTTGNSLTVPIFVPNRADITTGFAAGSQGNINAIIGGTELTRWTPTGLGIGTTSPFALLSVAGRPLGTTPVFSVSTSTASATSTVFHISSDGNVGISSSTPYAALSLGNRRSIITSEYIVATSSSFNVSALDGNKQLIRTGSAGITVTLIDFVPGASVNLKVCNPSASTAGAVTWAVSPGILAWVGGTVPTQTTTANKCDTWVFDATAATSTMKIFGSQAANF